MLLTTTNEIQGRQIVEYLGIVSDDAIMGANLFRDFFAGIRDIVGGRTRGYEKVLRDAKQAAIDGMVEQARELGADAVIGIDLDYEVIAGDNKSMLLVSASGTAVKLGR